MADPGIAFESRILSGDLGSGRTTRCLPSSVMQTLRAGHLASQGALRQTSFSLEAFLSLQ